MKTFKVKNYKGNLVESLKKFSDSHKGMKIVEAVEDKDELKIKAEESEEFKQNIKEAMRTHSGHEVDSEDLTIDGMIKLLKKFKNDLYKKGIDNSMEMFLTNSYYSDNYELVVHDENGNIVYSDIMIPYYMD